MLRRLIISLIILLGTVYAAPAGDFILVLDPGHGGKDSGCVGRKSCEKNIVLDIARRLGKRLETERKDIKVVYTRKDDRFISLQRRADIANEAHGNLFLSLHVNSVPKDAAGRSKTRGIAMYTLGPDKSSRSFEVAKRENSVMELEPDYTTRYKGFDPNSAESYIIFEMTSNLYMRQSIDFARATQTSLIRSTGRYDKGCHQAGFWVLWSPNMPSVLAELEFICNPTSEDYLNSEAGKEAIVNGLYDSVCKYASTYIRQNENTTAISNSNASQIRGNKTSRSKKDRSRRSDNKARR